MNFITAFIAHQMSKFVASGMLPFAPDRQPMKLPPVVQHRNPEHPRVERRKTGISARQQRRDTRTVNRALSHYDI